jgi:RNA polymerase sigma-70 factor (ECF subfamily)
MQDEGELIRAAAAGDRAAFDSLVRLKRERVVRIAYQVTGNWEDALDVGQTVFVKVWHGLGRFDPGRRFDTWLHRITVNAAIDQARSAGPRGMFAPLSEEPAAAAAATPDEAIDLARLQRAFHDLAGRLPAKQRAAFVLREIEGLPTDEVARIMGVTESTVRNHLLHVRRVLRAGIAREYPGFVPRLRRTGDDEESS